MDITFLSCAHLRCGIGRYSEELSKALSQKGHAVNGYRKQEANERFTTYPYRSFRNLRHYIAPYYLNKAVKMVSADIFQADYVDSAFAVTSDMLTKNKAALFTTVHDAIPFLYHTDKKAFAFYKWQLKKAAEKSEKLIVVSKRSKQDLVKFTGILPEKIEVVYNGINHDFFFPDTVKKQNNQFTIRYVGGLGGYKNVESLIQMAAILEQWKIDFRLEIGGSHPEKTGLPQLAANLNTKSVFFAGFIPDTSLRSFLAEADLMVFPSLYEGFGFPPLEAMASGTAVVASNRGSLPEVLRWGAITTEPTPFALAEAVRDVYMNPSLKSKMEADSIDVAAHYTWEKTARQMELIYGKKQISSDLRQAALL